MLSETVCHKQQVVAEEQYLATQERIRKTR